MEKKDTLFLMIPAYNEEANIINTVEQWYPIVEAHDGDGQSHLVVVDDGSRDNTLSLLQSAASCRPFMIVLTKENGGHGCVKKYIKLLPKHYGLPNVMLTVFFAYYGEPVRFRYITFKPRQGGENSINIIKIIKIGWQSLKDFYKIRRIMPKRYI